MDLASQKWYTPGVCGEFCTEIKKMIDKRNPQIALHKKK